MNGVKIFTFPCRNSKTWHLAGLFLSATASFFSSSVFASCEYTVNNEWNTGFTANIKITNTNSSAINGWTVGWQYSANRLTSSWSATVTGTNPYTATALAWNSVIQPGQSISFGVQGDKNNNGAAEIPALTGSVCSSVNSSSSTAFSSAISSSISSSVATTSSRSSQVSTSSSKSSSSSLLTSSSVSSVKTSSSSSSSVKTSSSSSSSKSASSVASSIATAQQCNWYGTLYPLCVTTASGWGYENNKSCIAAVTCSAQPAPYGIVGASSSSSIKSSSSIATTSSASSVKTSSSAISNSSVATSSSLSSSSSSSTVSGVIFQENFENAAVNTQPAGWDNFLAWNYNTTNSNTNSTYAVIDNSKAYSGSQSIHFKGSMTQIVRKLPAGIQRLHLRAYVNLSKKLGNDATDNHEHIMGIKKTQDANNEIRIGQIKGVLGTNEVPSDNIAPTMDKWYGGTELSPNTWYCIEVAMYADTAYDQLFMWVNGTLVHSITTASDWNNGPLGADWLSDKFNYVMFGFHSFSGNTADVWMDDVVVSTQPIGCSVN